MKIQYAEAEPVKPKSSWMTRLSNAGFIAILFVIAFVAAYYFA